MYWHSVVKQEGAGCCAAFAPLHVEHEAQLLVRDVAAHGAVDVLDACNGHGMEVRV